MSSFWKIALALTLAVGAAFAVGCRRDADVLRAAFDDEFFTRPDGYPGLSEHYNFQFARTPRQLDIGLMYRACADGTVDVINAFATDGRIQAFDLMVLEDDKHYFPPYEAAPLVRRDTLEAHPQIADALNRLGGQINDEDMQALNYAVDEEGLRADQAARDFLVEKGLLPEEFEAPARDAAAVSIGGKQFTEQEVLGEIMALMIEAHAGLRVNRRLNLGGTMICFNALRAGDLDLYAEYTGTGLVNILDEEPTTDPEATYARVQEAFGEQYGLAWLEPLGFNNTYTLTMRRAHAEELGIRTISDLAAHIRGNEED